MNQVLKVILYFVYLVSVLLVVSFCAHYIYIKKISEGNEASLSYFQSQWKTFGKKYMSKEQFLLFGAVDNRTINNINKFPVKKKKGVIRVGCIGDSFTLGEEVTSANSYPSFLQDFFRRDGTNVEVINFGNSWYGFQQSVFMYDYVGKKFDLDYVVFGPSGFFENRDKHFNHTNSIVPAYVHGRYILEEENLRLLKPLGDTFEERFEKYHSFFPKGQYLRYDYGIPSVLKAMLPEGRTLKNYFYYKKGKSDSGEALVIAGRLLSRINKETKVLLFNTKKEFVDTAKASGIESYYLYDDQLAAFDNDVEYKFPYYRITHYGPNLNYEFARYVYNVISGEEDYLSRKIIFSNLENVKESAEVFLEKTIDMKIEMNGFELGEFMQKSDRYTTPHLEPVDIQNVFKTYKGLVTISPKKQSIIYGQFFPVKYSLDKKQVLFLSPDKKGTQKLKFGKIDLKMGSNLGVLQSKLSVRGVDAANFGQIFLDSKDVPESFNKYKKLFLYIGADLFLIGVKAVGGYLFENHDINPWLIRASADEFINPYRLAKTGKAYLKLKTVNGKSKRIPLAKWGIQKLKTRNLKFSRPISKGL